MKKTVGLFLSLLITFSVMGSTVLATDYSAENTSTIKTVEVSLNDIVDITATNTRTQELAKDFATSFGQTGIITSIGQYVDFSKVLPPGATVVSVTMYCPTTVRITQSKYTAIENFLIDNGYNKPATIPFVRTNSPTPQCKTTVPANTPANVKWFVQIQSRILMQETGMDGFTVFGGSKMVIEYK